MRILLVLLFLLTTVYAKSQKYTLEKSTVLFFSEAAIENIKANNTKSTSIFNSENGEIVFSIPIKEFEFEKALMKEHFNEKYLESDKYPKALFQGKLVGLDSGKVGQQEVKAVGKITIHGIGHDMEILGTVEFSRSTMTARAKFKIHLADFKIKIPQLLWQNIAEDVEVTVEFIYKTI